MISIAVRRSVFSFAVILAAVACSDTTPPPNAPPAPPAPVLNPPPAPPAPVSTQGPIATSPQHTHAHMQSPVVSMADGGKDVPALSQDKVQIGVQPSIPKLQACYDNGLTKNAKLAGLVKVKFTITPAGDVVDVVDNGSTLPDNEVIKCVITVFDQITYPRFDGKAVLSVYPIDFTPPAPSSDRELRQARVVWAACPSTRPHPSPSSSRSTATRPSARRRRAFSSANFCIGCPRAARVGG